VLVDSDVGELNYGFGFVGSDNHVSTRDYQVRKLMHQAHRGGLTRTIARESHAKYVRPRPHPQRCNPVNASAAIAASRTY